MIPQVTVTQKPVSPGRARHKPLTPLRRECRCFGWTCGEYACVLFAFAHEAAGAAQHPAFPAPSLSSRDTVVATTRTLLRRGNAESCLASLRAKRSNPGPRAKLWI